MEVCVRTHEHQLPHRSGFIPGQSWYESATARQIHEDQLRRVELINGRAAMLGFVIGLLAEALAGQGILHQIGLATVLSQG